jgi:hypothetical protein
MGATRSTQALDDRPQESSRTTGWFHDDHVSKIAIGRVVDHVENRLDHLTTSENLAMFDGLLQ